MQLNGTKMFHDESEKKHLFSGQKVKGQVMSQNIAGMGSCTLVNAGLF